MTNLILTEPPVNTPSRAQRGKIMRAYSKAGILAGVDENLLRRTVGAFLAAGVDPALSTSGALAKEIRANQVALLGAIVNTVAEDLFADPKAQSPAEVHLATPRW